MSDAFNELYNIIREGQQIPSFFYVAIVSSPLPNLKIKLEGIELDKDDFLIDKWLVDRNKNMFTKEVTCSAEHTHEIKEPIKDILKIGDKLLVTKVDNQYIVLSKVVNI